MKNPFCLEWTTWRKWSISSNDKKSELTSMTYKL